MGVDQLVTGGDVDDPVVDSLSTGHLWLGQQPETPSDSEIGSGNVALYAKTDGGLYTKPYGGVESAVGSGGGDSEWTVDGDGNLVPIDDEPVAVSSLEVGNRRREELVDEIILDGDQNPNNTQVFDGLSNDALYELYIEANSDSGGKLFVQFNDDTASGNGNYEWYGISGTSNTDDAIVLWSQGGVTPVRGYAVIGQSTQSGGGEAPTLRNRTIGGRAGSVNQIGEWGGYQGGSDLNKIHITMGPGWRSGQTHTLELWRVR